MNQQLVPSTPFDMTDIAGLLKKSSERIYAHDMQVFAEWILAQGLLPEDLTRSSLIAYRHHLLEEYANSTAQRMFSVARRLLQELVYTGRLEKNPTDGVKGITTDDETTHIALTKGQVKELLASIDTTTKKGLRDYVIIKLMARTGLRRSECAHIQLGHLTMEQGHHILLLPDTKSKKRQLVKIPVDVYRLIEEYKERIGISQEPANHLLFVGFDRGDHPTSVGITDKLIWRRVKYYAGLIGVERLSAHGLRATFITLALDEDVPLHQVQYAARHKDPRTTQRYHTRKINLDKNAVDALDF